MKHIFNWIRNVVIWVGFALISFDMASATSIGVDPLFIEVSPQKASVLRVQNASDMDIPVEIFVYERMVDEKGVETRREADDDFIVFPPQAVIRSSSVQNIRFQPIVNNVTESRSYFITVRQIPVELSDKPEGMYVKVVFAFDAAVHIVPAGTAAKPEVTGVSATTMELPTGDKQTTRTVPAVAINMENNGNKYLYLQDYKYEISGVDTSGNNVRLDGWSTEDIIENASVVLLKPGEKRRFKLATDQVQGLSDLKIKLSPR